MEAAATQYDMEGQGSVERAKSEATTPAGSGMDTAAWARKVRGGPGWHPRLLQSQ